MGIDSHGNNGHSHSYTGCFPFLPIPIPNFVTNSHYHGNPMGFPFPLGIPFPWSSLVQTTRCTDSCRNFRQLRASPESLDIVVLCHSLSKKHGKIKIQVGRSSSGGGRFHVDYSRLFKRGHFNLNMHYIYMHRAP